MDAAALRPTFFELFAAERLTPGVKGALLYALSVAAQRRPRALAPVLEWGDEAYLLLALVLEGTSLASADGTFAEGLYALRRAPAHRKGSLSRRQRAVCLLWLCVLPYLRDKMAASAARRRQAADLEAFGLDGVLQRDDDGVALDAAAAAANAEGEEDALTAERRRDASLPPWRRSAERLSAAAFPWVHASLEAASLGCMLAYLLGATEYFSPAMAAAGVVPRRVSAAQVAASDAAQRTARAAAVARAAKRGAAAAAGVRAAHWLADSARVALVGGVLGFKVLEWWYTSAEERLNASKALAPPPPPPAMRPAHGGVGLPKKPTHCPLCLKPRQNPALAAPSGYAFCYPCLYRYVTDHARCPVTLAPMTHDDIRKLFLDN